MIYQNPDILLTICIGAIPERFEKAFSLYTRLMAEVADRPVQVLLIMDNKVMEIGQKRNALVQIAAGKYISFIDDDEDFFTGYVEYMVNACKLNPDVITFMQKCTIDGKSFTVNFDLDFFNRQNPNAELEQVQKNDEGEYIDINRPPFHVCGWKHEIISKHEFAEVGYSEDWDLCKRVLPEIKTQYKIPGFMHHYIYDSKVTAAPTVSNKVWKNPKDKK